MSARQPAPPPAVPAVPAVPPGAAAAAGAPPAAVGVPPQAALFAAAAAAQQQQQQTQPALNARSSHTSYAVDPSVAAASPSKLRGQPLPPHTAVAVSTAGPGLLIGRPQQGYAINTAAVFSRPQLLPSVTSATSDPLARYVHQHHQQQHAAAAAAAAAGIYTTTSTAGSSYSIPRDAVAHLVRATTSGDPLRAPSASTLVAQQQPAAAVAAAAAHASSSAAARIGQVRYQGELYASGGLSGYSACSRTRIPSSSSSPSASMKLSSKPYSSSSSSSSASHMHNRSSYAAKCSTPSTTASSSSWLLPPHCGGSSSHPAVSSGTPSYYPNMEAVSAATAATSSGNRASSSSKNNSSGNSSSSQGQRYAPWKSSDTPYLREASAGLAVGGSAAGHPAAVLSLHPAAAAGAAEIHRKRPRFSYNSGQQASSQATVATVPPHTVAGVNLHPSAAHQVAVAAAASGASSASSVAAAAGGTPLPEPLRIDTRDAVNAGYHPQVEQISPTDPDTQSKRDELKSTKDNLMHKITMLDREIAKAESVIAKLKKKQQELEEAANKTSSDQTEEEEEEERPKSIAQVVYAENRKRARQSQKSLEKLAPLNDLPLYNQPSDTEVYYENRRTHEHFKKHLIAHFRRKHEAKEARDRYLTETYAKLMAQWSKKAERLENSKRRKEREAKSREMYEKIFPELRKQREDKERDHRLGTRGAVRSEADIEDVIERLQEQEMEDKKMHSYAVIPPVLLPPDERKRRFTNNNGLIHDPMKEYNDRKFLNTWTDAEKDVFKEKYLLHPKNFGQIAANLERKSVSDCVQYYYLSKKTENYKQLMRRVRGGGRKTRKNAAASAAAAGANDSVMSSGVVTRHRRNEEANNGVKSEKGGGDSAGNSNRSTPQPAMKGDIKTENGEDSDKKKGGADSTDEEEDTKTKATGPGKTTMCPIPSCTTTKGRVKGRLRHLPKKWATLSKENRENIANELQIPPGTKKCCSACLLRITRKISHLPSSTASSPAAQTSTSGEATPTAIKEEGGSASEKSNAVKSEPKALGVKTEKGEIGGKGSSAAGAGSATTTIWTDEEVELMKRGLRAHGRTWGLISEKMAGRKTPDACKKFFYDFRKKYQLDKIVYEYKRANQTGDQPPTLSTDEESGSSTSSCEDDPNSGARKNSEMKPPIKTEVKPELKVEPASTPDLTVTSVTAAPPHQSANKPVMAGLPVKEEEYDSSATMSADEASDLPPGGRGNPGLPFGYPTPGASYLGLRGATAVASSERAALHQQQQQVAGIAPGARATFGDPRLRAPPSIPTSSYKPNAIMRPPQPAGTPVATNEAPTDNGPRDVITVKELMMGVIERSLSGPPGRGPGAPGNNGSNITGGPTARVHPSSASHSVTPNLSGGSSVAGSASAQSVSPTIHNILEQSARPKQGSMAPPIAPSSSGGAGGSGSNDCETLDLSMPRKRDPSPPVTSQTSGYYREPNPHHPRSSPSLTGDYPHGTAAHGNKNPPPAHSGSLMKTNHPEAYMRQAPSPVVYGPDGRPLPSALHRTGPSPSGIHQRSGSAAVPPASGSRGAAPAAMSYMSSRQPPPPAPPKANPSGPSMSPKLAGNRPLSVQTGSITQGTPVNQGIHRPGYAPAEKTGGSITHGTPYDKKHHPVLTVGGGSAAAEQHYYNNRLTTSPATSGYSYPSGAVPPGTQSGRPASYGGPQSSQDSHLSSRQVIMNDYAMARSTEMRRPDSREAQRPLSPARMSARDHSPMPRPALEVRRDPRFDARHLQDPRGDPKADLRGISEHRASSATLHEVRSDARYGLDPRGDPRASLDPRSDPRAALDPRLDPRVVAAAAVAHDSRSAAAGSRSADHRIVTDPRSNLIDHRRASSNSSYYLAPSQQPGVYVTPDGKYVQHASASRSRSPSRSSIPASTPPPARSSNSAAVIHRGGGITSGKPVLTSKAPAAIGHHREVEIYRTNPEVTISKTSSPRYAYANPALVPGADPNNAALASLVDIAVQQPKLPASAASVATNPATIAAIARQHPPYSASAASERQQIELDKVQRYAKAAAASSIPPLASSSSISSASVVPRSAGSTSTPQIVQQVRSERAKQMYLIQDKERMERMERDFPASATVSSGSTSAATITSSSAAKIAAVTAQAASGASSNHGGISAAALAAANLGASGGKDELPRRGGDTLTAANLIETIIHRSINAGPPADTGTGPPAHATKAFRRSPAEIAASTPQEDNAAKAAAAAAAAAAANKAMGHPLSNGPDDPNSLNSASNSAPGSRPGSRSGLLIQEASERVNNSTTSAQSQGSTTSNTVVSTVTPPSSSSGFYRTTMSSTPASASSSQSNTPTNLVKSTAAASSHRFVAGGKLPESTSVTSVKVVTAGTINSASLDPGAAGDPRGRSGISPLDYVKNKIAEEMKKGDEAAADATPTTAAPAVSLTPTTSAASSSSLKRPLENHVPAPQAPPPPANGGTQVSPPSGNKNGNPKDEPSPAKKARLDEVASSVGGGGPEAMITPSANAFVPPDSPDSEGEMVIDESEPPASSEAAKSGPPPAPDNPATADKKVVAASVPAVVASSGSSEAKSASVGPVAAGGAAPASVSKPQYEPLSDDD